MSSVLYALGRRMARARYAVLVAWLVVLALAGAGGIGMLHTGPDDTFTLPGQSSQQALDRLDHVFPEVGGTSAQILVVVPEGASVRAPGVRKAVTEATHRAEKLDQVEVVANPFDAGIKNALSADDRAALITVFFSVDHKDVSKRTLDQLTAVGEALRRGLGAGATVDVGGDAYHDIIPRLSPTEGVGLLIAFAVLMVMFGSFVAAGVPILTALVGVGVGYGFIYTAMRWTVISSTAPMIAVMIGLAVGIDYALFILSRHRDQLHEGLDVEESIARATATAGSAVVFAGLTVMIAFTGLFVAGIPFLTRMGQAGTFGVLVAVLVALTALPALLAVAGERLRPRPRPRRGGRRGRRACAERGVDALPRHWFASAWVSAVTRFPLPTILIVVLALVVCAVPVKNLQLALPNNGTDEPGTPARITYDAISEHFGPGYNSPLLVMLDALATDDPVGVTKDVAKDVERVPGVAAVPLATPNRSGDTSIIEVVPDSAGDSKATSDLVRRLRALAPHIRSTYGVDSSVTGFTAVTIDISQVLGRSLLPFLAIVVGLSLVLLAMVFRSIAVPIKASIGYLLSLGSAFGVTTFVFVDGHGAGLVRAQHVGNVISFLPIILMGVLFGLAMDYEMFLVSRMREAYVLGGDAAAAIRTGFLAASRVVVAAALIMIGVFAAFVPHGSATIKPIAFALAVGVFVDAFVIRMTFVPAVMALLGERAWWLPGWLDRRLPVFDAEGDGLERELRLGTWPGPGTHDIVAARGLTLVADDGTRVIDGLSFRVRPGQVLLVEGERPCGKSALLLALGGHIPTLEGDLKVGGDVLPQHNRRVRRRVALVLADPSADVAAQVRRALDDGVRLVLLDDLDHIVRRDQRRALGDLLRAISSLGPSAPAVIATCQDQALLDDVLTGVPVVDLPLALDLPLSLDSLTPDILEVHP